MTPQPAQGAVGGNGDGRLRIEHTPGVAKKGSSTTFPDNFPDNLVDNLVDNFVDSCVLFLFYLFPVTDSWGA